VTSTRAARPIPGIASEGSTMVSDYGINDTSSQLKDITSVVSPSFEVR
jgi:hypothetical protein